VTLGLLPVVLAGLLTTAPAAAAGPGEPTSPVPAPEVVEGFSPYLGQVSCDPTPKPGTMALREMVLATYGGRDLGIGRACGVGGASEHKEGRAWDWGLDAAKPAEAALAERFLTWLLAPGPNGMAAYNARRLGVMYVIWDRKVWSQYRAADGWRSYGGSAHRDHVHISMTWNGATKRASWWTGKAPDIDYGPCVEVEGQPAAPWREPRLAPCPDPTPAASLTDSPKLRRGDTGPYVAQLQQLLSVEPVSGYFGPLTEAAVRSLQERHGLKVTGRTSKKTWRAARSGGPVAAPPPSPAPSAQPVVAGRALPSRMRYVVRKGDSLSRIAKVWRSTVPAIKSASGLRGDVIRVGQTITVPVRSSITKFTWTSLSRGDRGVVVKALQTALRMKRKYRTGLFGPITERRVNRFKSRRGWPADGVAGPGVWRALGA
jgi:peptidoglycan hydrolase-like protein with peptidoglycan-binding domain